MRYQEGNTEKCSQRIGIVALLFRLQPGTIVLLKLPRYYYTYQLFRLCRSSKKLPEDSMRKSRQVGLAFSATASPLDSGRRRDFFDSMERTMYKWATNDACPLVALFFYSFKQGPVSLPQDMGQHPRHRPKTIRALGSTTAATAIRLYWTFELG